jgi:DNA ligase-1
MGPEEVAVGVAYLSGILPQGSIGVGWASLRDLPDPAPGPPTLQLMEVDRSLSRLGGSTGSGSQAARRAELAGLFGQATERERTFLIGLLLGELRQGALGGVMVEAVARATGIPAADIRRAQMLSGDLGQVAAVAMGRGRRGLAQFRLHVLRPILPMLAQTAGDLPDALARIRPASVEWKLDGARLQVHRLGDEVRAFTRNLADVTERAPDVVEAVRALPVESVILDGEAIALRPNGRPYPFQVTMGRFGSRLEVEQHRASRPLSVFFFDCLHLDGEDLIDRPLAERWRAMEDRLPPEIRVRRIVTEDVAEGERFLAEALAGGQEGVMVKALDAPYEAGRRGAGWLKVKKAHTLDLVVLAAEWGHGRRRGWLSNLHLGARDPATGGYVMLGKTFKGMTDEMLRWQTKRFQELETHREGITVFVRPEVVVEVAFDGLQASPRYPAGLALRFARIKGYRPDKRPEDADTIDTVRAIHAATSGTS